MVHNAFFNYLLLSFLAVFSISALQISPEINIVSFDELKKIDIVETTLAFSPEFVTSHGIEEDFNLLYDKDGFYVRTRENDVRVKTYDTDKLLRKRSASEIIKYAMLGKFKVSKFDNGEYVVQLQGQLNGGGIVTAITGAHLGMFTTNILGHIVLLSISSFSGAAAPAVYSKLAIAYSPSILLASKIVSVGFGITGVMTGDFFW